DEKPGRAPPELMPTVPPVRPTLVNPRNINNTVTATITMTIGRVCFISRPQNEMLFHSGDIVLFALIDRCCRPNRSSLTLSIRKEQNQEYCEYAYADRESSPKQSHEGRRDGIRLNSMSRRHVILGPGGDFAVVEGLSLPPTHKRQQWFVVGIVNEDVFE